MLIGHLSQQEVEGTAVTLLQAVSVATEPQEVGPVPSKILETRTGLRVSVGT